MDGSKTTQILESLNSDVLKSIARQLGLPKELTRKADLAAALERFLAEQTPALLEHLSDMEKKCLAEAVHGKGKVSCDVFKAKYGHQCPIPRTRLGYGAGERKADVLALMAMHVEDELIVPGEMIARLRPLLPKPAPLKIRTLAEAPAKWDRTYRSRDGDQVEELPVRLFAGERTVFQELKRVLALAQTGKVRIAPKSGRPTDAATRLLGEALVQPDLALEPPEEDVNEWTAPGGAVRAHAWGVLTQQCGWCKAEGERLAMTRAGREFLTSGGPESFRQAVQRCLTDDEFDELNRIPNIRGQSGKAKRYMTRPVERKQAVCRSMEHWPAGQWVAFADALRFVYASGNRLRVYPGDWGQLYFAELQYGKIHDDSGLSAQYMRAFLMETLGTLGLVDLAYVYPHWVSPDGIFQHAWGVDDLDYCGRYDGLLAARMNALGAYCLGQTETYEAPPAEKRSLFTVLANLELAITSDVGLSAADKAALEMFASRTGDHVWRIDGRRILDHMESGGELDDITRALEANSAQDIPQTVRVLLDDLRKKLGAFGGTEDALLLEVNDPAVAALIAHDSQAGKCCALVDHGRLVVPQKNLRGFRNAVKALGYLMPR